MFGWKLHFWIALLAFFSISFVEGCPFASYKHGAYQKKDVQVILPPVNTKELCNHLHVRYALALEELRYNYPYNPLELQGQIDQLEEFISQTDSSHEFKSISKTTCVLNLLHNPKYKEHFTGKERYRYFIDTLRTALNEKNAAKWSNPKVQHTVQSILQEISMAHFSISLNHTKVGYQHFWELMPKKLLSLDPSQLNVKLMNKAINHLFPLRSPRVFLSRIHRKMHAPIFASWDGALASLRCKIADYQWADRSVSLIRMSCPVYGKNYCASVDPIFLEYLETLKVKGKKHLYVNNLNTLSNMFSNEYKNSKKLQELSRRSEYRKNFCFITLPFDSPFYKQGNLGLLRASYFKETFLNSMLMKQEGFYFPSRLLKDSDFVSFLETLIDDLHCTYFAEKDFLERVERCQFIDIAYAYIVKYLIQEQNIDIVNWTCRYGIDRSMSAVAVFDILLQSLSDSPAHLGSMFYISSWPAILNYHRHPETERLVRCYSAVRKLLEIKKDSISESHKEYNINSLAI